MVINVLPFTLLLICYVWLFCSYFSCTLQLSVYYFFNIFATLNVTVIILSNFLNFTTSAQFHWPATLYQSFNTKSRILKTGLDRPMKMTCQSKFVNGLQEIYCCMQSSRPVQTKSRKLTGLDRPIRITCRSKFVNGLQEIYFCMQSSWACPDQLKNTENRSHCLKSRVLKTQVSKD